MTRQQVTRCRYPHHIKLSLKKTLKGFQVGVDDWETQCTETVWEAGEHQGSKALQNPAGLC